jgi:tetratricopeptide (TPR) repeat protein
MSDNENSGEFLERNVAELLRRAHQPPKIDDQARSRILADLETRLDERRGGETADEPTESRGWLASLLSTPRRAALVAGLSIAAASAAGYLLLAGGGDEPARFESAEHQNDQPAPRRVELADGSSAILRSGAAIVELAPRRIELIRGDVLFDVARGQGRFVVSRPEQAGRVVVLGTRFVVSGGDDTTLAAVIRGRVRLEGDGADLELGAGEGGELAGGVPTRRPVERLSHMTSWARAARIRAEGKDVEPARRGNLIARFPNWGTQDYPLPVRDLTVDVHVENQVARVAVDQTFFNEQAFQLEGVYSFALPPDAAISRLAMYVEENLMEAGLAERVRARQVYEQIVYRRRDPALMEWMQGNEVKVRIFPLPGRQEKRILLSYTQPLERLYDDVTMSIPLPRLDQPIGELNFRARLTECARCEVASTTHPIQTAVDGADLLVTYKGSSVEVTDDLLLTIRQPRPRASVSVERADFGHYMIARIKPLLASGEPTSRARRRWVIVDDTSASRSPLERAAQVHIADRMMTELDERDEVALIAFDSTVRRHAGGVFTEVAQIDPAAVHGFFERESRDGVGATDLGAALSSAAELLDGSVEAGYEPHIIYMGDGVVTGGARATGDLVARIRGKAAFVGLAVGARQDRAVLQALAAATGGAAWTLNPGQDLDWAVFDLVAALNTGRVTRVSAEIDGGLDGEPVYLSTRQIADGEELVVIARVGDELPRSISLRGLRDGDTWTHRLDLADADVDRGAGYLPRLWARRHIDALLADESADHQKAIVDLAMEQWLLTPHTSLLVLENDEAYKRFKVTRSSDTGWAAYQTPKKIEVVREPLTSVSALSKVSARAMIFRDPLQLFREHGLARVNGIRLEGSIGAGGGGVLGGLDATGDATGWGTIGAGSFGAVGASRLTALEDEKDGKAKADTPAAVPATGQAPVADEARMAEVRVQAQGFASREVTFEVDRRSDAWSRSRGPRPSRRARRAAGEQVLSQDKSHHWSYQASAPIPLALHHAGDPRFEDLTALIDGFYSDELDRERARLLRSNNDGERRPVEDRARQMLERARRLAAGRRYTDSGGGSAEITEGGGFRIVRTTSVGLREQLLYDGEQLTTHYPELGINLSRTVGDVEPWLLEAELPLLAPDPEALSRFYALTATPGAVVATPAKAGWSLVYRIDGEGRFAGVERRGEDAGVIYAIRHEAGAVIVAAGDREVRYDAVELPVVLPPSVPAGLSVDMPLRHPKYWDAAIAGGKAPRSAWTQLIASHAALDDRASVKATLDRMLEAGLELSAAELVIAAGGVVLLEDRPFAAAVAGGGDHPVVDYLRAARRFRGDRRAAHLKSIAADESWLGTFALYRQALRLAEEDGVAPFSRALSALIDRGLPAPLRYIAVYRINQHQLWRKPLALVELWDRVAESGPWHVTATVQAATALVRGGEYEKAAARFDALVDESLARGELPPLDYNARNAFFSGPRGQPGWMAYWSQIRERVIDSGDSDLIVAMLRAAMAMSQQADVERLTTAALDLDLDGEIRLDLIAVLVGHGRTAEAGLLFEPLWESVDDGSAADPDLYLWAASFRETRGRFMSAAKLYDRHLSLMAGESSSLAQVRAELTRLIGLYSRAARLSAADREAALAGVRDVASRWRAIDPDNPAIDQQVSTLMFAVDRDQEAMRYLMTAIERHPMEGSAYNTVAAVLQGSGRIADAAGLWERAAEIEPDNPTWALNAARARLALGQTDAARAHLARIIKAKKETHERFAWIVTQAEQLDKQLE